MELYLIPNTGRGRHATVLGSYYSQKIKDLRETKGLTQTQFAELVGVSFATVNRWENGQSRPNKLAWNRIIELSEAGEGHREVQPTLDEAPSMDFAPTRTRSRQWRRRTVSPMATSSTRHSPRKPR